MCDCTQMLAIETHSTVFNSGQKAVSLELFLYAVVPRMLTSSSKVTVSTLAIERFFRRYRTEQVRPDDSSGSVSDLELQPLEHMTQ